MKTVCPHCKQEFPDTPDEYLGMPLECPLCKKVFICEQSKLCSGCGAINPLNALQCAQCGKSFLREPQVLPQLPPTPPADPVAAGNGRSESDEFDEIDDEDYEEHNGPSYRKWLILGVVMVVIVAAVIGGIHLIRNWEQAKKQEQLRQEALRREQQKQQELQRKRERDAAILKRLKEAVVKTENYLLGSGLERAKTEAKTPEKRAQAEKQVHIMRTRNAERFLNEINAILRSGGYPFLDEAFQQDFKSLTVFSHSDAHDTLKLLNLSDKLSAATTIAEFCDAIQKTDLPINIKEKLLEENLLRESGAADQPVWRIRQIAALRKQHDEKLNGLHAKLHYLENQRNELRRRAFYHIQNQLSRKFFSFEDADANGDAKDKQILRNTLRKERIYCSQFGLRQNLDIGELDKFHQEIVENINRIRFFIPENLKILRGIALFPGKNENPLFTTENGCLIDCKTRKLLYVIPKKDGKYAIPSGVSSIEARAFIDCGDFIWISPTGIVRGGRRALNSQDLQSLENGKLVKADEVRQIVIPDGMTALKSGLFKNCCNLTSVTIPSSVESIGDHVFAGCSKLDLTIPKSVKFIGKRAFAGCAVTKIEIPDGVKSIGDYAFEGCERLASVTIPSSVESIGKSAFYRCVKLNTIDIAPDSMLKNIGAGAFFHAPCESQILKRFAKYYFGLPPKDFVGTTKGLIFYSMLDGRHASMPATVYGNVQIVKKDGFLCSFFRGAELKRKEKWERDRRKAALRNLGMVRVQRNPKTGNLERVRKTTVVVKQRDGDALIFGNNRLLSKGKPCTMSIWAYSTSLEKGKETAFAVGNRAPGAMLALFREGQQIKFAGGKVLVREYRRSHNRWACYTLTYDGYSIQMYVNGRHIGGNPVKLDPRGGFISIGGIPEKGGFTESWSGYLAQAKLYDRVLTPAEIKGLSPF